MDGRSKTLPKYMLVHQKKASLYDVLHLLFSGNLRENGSIICPIGSEKMLVGNLRLRWAIAISVFLQIVFRELKGFVLRVGTKIEGLGNFVLHNNGFGGILRRFLLGKLVRPDAKSGSYRSSVSLLDGRMELDKSIKRGDSRYVAALSVMASKLAYENEETIKHTIRDVWNMEFLKYFNCWNELQGQSSTQAFMLVDPKQEPRLVVVAFRGTEPFNLDDWSVDVDLSWYEIPGVGKIHGGFMKALGLQPHAEFWSNSSPNATPRHAYSSIRDALKQQLRRLEPNSKFVLTGHSLGGALAVLFPLALSLDGEEELLERLEGVYTFGQPRVGDSKVGSFMSSLLDGRRQRYFRFVYNNDVVPRLYFHHEALLFVHWSNCLHYDHTYKCQVLKEDPYKKYWCWQSLWNYYSCGAWEIVRGLFLGLERGREYREGWLQIALRLVALSILMPGLAQHGLRDYINCIRLGNTLEGSPHKESK